MIRLLLVLLVTFLSFISNVNSHSWLACSDYDAVVNGQDYDDSNCNGYPRDWTNYGGSSFGADSGWDYRPSGSGGDWCNSELNGLASDYTITYPYAKYTLGETVRLLWPAKNHANYECGNYIPDFEMKIYAAKTGTTDPTNLSDFKLVIDWHDEAGTTSGTGTDGVPFQNCPDYCSDTGNAVCYGDFVVDDTSIFTETGTYTFLWYWAFNSDTDLYSTCWEAYVDTLGVVTPVNAQTPAPTPRPTDVDDTPSPTPPPTPSPTPAPTPFPTPRPTNVGDTPQPTTSPTEAAETSDDDYIITIPVCYSGAEYDDDILESAAEGLFPGSYGIEFFIIKWSQNADDWNATLYTQTSYPAEVTDTVNFWVYGKSTNDMCKAIVSGFGEGECEICQDYVVYSVDVYEEEVGDIPTSPDSGAISLLNPNYFNLIVLIAIGLITSFR